MIRKLKIVTVFCQYFVLKWWLRGHGTLRNLLCQELYTIISDNCRGIARNKFTTIDKYNIAMDSAMDFSFSEQSREEVLRLLEMWVV